ncbi:hypothetical protein XENTR_v10014901 [Xenopus tropicalis]|nr:hypothetical protein XENTR_v10014901 [Xenopus tropicalis]
MERKPSCSIINISSSDWEENRQVSIKCKNHSDGEEERKKKRMKVSTNIRKRKRSSSSLTDNSSDWGVNSGEKFKKVSIKCKNHSDGEEEREKKRQKLSSDIRKRKRSSSSITDNSSDWGVNSGEKFRKRKSGSTDSSAGEGCSQRPCVQVRRPLALDITSYTFHRVLGRGTFGKVMLASTPTNSQQVAIKVIVKKPQMANRQSILREARVLRVAAGHPYLCHMHAAFQTQNYAFIAMEFASGGSLKDLLKKEHHLKTRQVIFYSAEMVCGLQYLHSRGIIHCDLKPDNILISSEGHIKIADFGLAVEHVFGHDTTCGYRGTPKYMAPEVLADQRYNAAVDWWAFGIILCQMATGWYPFDDKHGDAALRHSILENRAKVPAWTPSKLVILLRKLLRKKACNRYGVKGNIRQCLFFDSIDWETLENGRLPPPFQLEAMQQLAENNEGCQMNNDSVPTGVNIIEGFSYQCPSWQE